MIRVYLRYVPRYPISDARKKEMVFISQGTYLISEVRARVLFYFIQAYTYLPYAPKGISDTTLV